MRDPGQALSTGSLVLRGLPTAAVGFCISSAVASITRLQSTRDDLHVGNIALIWLMGPLPGLLVQPMLDWLTDRTGWLGERRRPRRIAGGLLGGLATFSLLHLDTLAAGLVACAHGVALAFVFRMAVPECPPCTPLDDR